MVKIDVFGVLKPSDKVNHRKTMIFDFSQVNFCKTAKNAFFWGFIRTFTYKPPKKGIFGSFAKIYLHFSPKISILLKKFSFSIFFKKGVNFFAKNRPKNARIFAKKLTPFLKKSEKKNSLFCRSLASGRRPLASERQKSATFLPLAPRAAVQLFLVISGL